MWAIGMPEYSKYHNLILLYRYIACIVSKNFGHLYQFKVSGRRGTAPVLGSARTLTLIK